MPKHDRSNQRPFEPAHPAEPVQHTQGGPWLEQRPSSEVTTEHHLVERPPEKPEAHEVKLPVVNSVLKRVVCLERLDCGLSPTGKVRLVFELDLGVTRAEERDSEPLDYQNPAHQLASFGGALSLALARKVNDGEDFVVLTQEERELVDRHREQNRG